MKIGVCIKQVPDTASKIRIQGEGAGVQEENLKFVISPYDEYAVEEALRTKEKIEGSEVVVISLGPKRAQEAIRSALAMGCDRAVHINSEDQKYTDGLVVARLLAHAIKTEGLELVFTGRHAADDDNAQVSQMVAELLDWPQVTQVSKFELESDGKKARVERDIEGGARQVWEVTLPAVIAANKGLNEPRYAALKGIMAAKKKPLDSKTVAETGIGQAELTSKTTWSNYALPPERPEGKIFKDDPAESVKEVVRLLREEAKAI